MLKFARIVIVESDSETEALSSDEPWAQNEPLARDLISHQFFIQLPHPQPRPTFLRGSLVYGLNCSLPLLVQKQNNAHHLRLLPLLL